MLLTGCDKTTPACLMGAASVDLPTIVVNGGPMLNGKFRGRDIGSGTDVWRLSDDLRLGRITVDDYHEAESCMSRSDGHCMTMGTASTMACMVEALGVTLPGAAAIPAADSRRRRLAHLSGRRIVEMVREDLRLSQILTRPALENAIRVNAAVGGSTNFVLHLLALAGRLGIPLELDDFDRLGSQMPLLVNLMPSGEYLMEDFFYAGGLPVVIQQLRALLHMDAPTVNGGTQEENTAGAENYNHEVIADFNAPFQREAGISILRGNLCPDGAVIKPSAAAPELLQHRGRAVVFEDIDDYHQRIDDPDLEVSADSVLVLKQVGPRGFPGMPEVGNFSLPKKLMLQGVEDMVRISDGRMSGTAFGAVVLHVAPESALGSALALVQNGDEIELDVPARRLQLLVSPEELRRRRELWRPRPAHGDRGYTRLYVEHVQQANSGVDFDFLRGSSGAAVKHAGH